MRVQILKKELEFLGKGISEMKNCLRDIRDLMAKKMEED